MKTRLIALSLLVVFTASVISGCATASATQLSTPTQHIPQAEVADVVRTLNEPNPSLETAPMAMTQRITAQEAEHIALAHAGIAAADVHQLHTEFDYDDGIPEYSVEFRHDGWEYDYEIHAETGEILRSESEPDPTAPPATEPPATEPPVKEPKATEPPATEPPATEPPATEPPATEPPATEPPATEPPATEPEVTRLSKEQILAIALKHAGLSKDQVSRLKAEFDVDDGVPQYDVEFKYDGWEYEYEIHAESGKILKWDKDQDD